MNSDYGIKFEQNSVAIKTEGPVMWIGILAMALSTSGVTFCMLPKFSLSSIKMGLIMVLSSQSCCEHSMSKYLKNGLDCYFLWTDSALFHKVFGQIN